MNVWRMFRKVLEGSRLYQTEDTFLRHQRAYVTATLLVRVYYVATLLIVVTTLGQRWNAWLTRDVPTLLWPLTWISLIEFPTAVNLIAVGAILSAAIAAFFPEKRIFRLLVFLGLLQISALANTFGKIGHDYHAWVAVAFIFIFLANDGWQKAETSITARQRFLFLFWTAQVAIFMFYSMAGSVKVGAAVLQFLEGQVHAFHPQALAYQVAGRLDRTGETGLLGPIAIKYSWLGWPMFLSAIYLEAFAFIAAFRPALHKIWGICLILLHLGIYLVMGIRFPHNIFLLGILFVNSPFLLKKNSWKYVCWSLPLFGDILTPVYNFTSTQHINVRMFLRTKL